MEGDKIKPSENEKGKEESGTKSHMGIPEAIFVVSRMRL